MINFTKEFSIFSISFLILVSFSCKKNHESPSTPGNNTPTSTICDVPVFTDMTGSKSWGDGTPASCTQATLQNLLNEGGKIKCNCGAAAFTLTLNATLTVPNKEIIMEGNNLITLDGANFVRIFDKQAASNQGNGTLFGLQNLKLINGKANLNANERGGAAILGRAFGSMKIFNVTFENNNGPSSASDDCGAVHSILYQNVLFANCIFNNNKGANGGAVGAIGSGMSFINCRFEGNEATGTGGTFDKGGSGGAIYVDGTYQNGVNNTLSLCGCIFNNNKAGHQGGAYNVVQYDGKGGSGTIDKCSFSNNKCNVAQGGGVYYQDGILSITNSTFDGNLSPSQGGGIWYNNGTLTLNNCTIKGNKAGDNSNGLGGGLAMPSVNNASITNCTFAENQAGNFASAIFNGGNTTLTNNLFYKNAVGTGFQSNPYGGAVINKGSNLTVSDGNLQYPKDFSGQYGQGDDYWLTPNVLLLDAQLQPLADNGGPTKTMALPSGSPAIDKGTITNAPLTDQRGKGRKGNVDIGAYEVQ